MIYDTDIVISGAGPAGLAAACALGAEGHSVILLDPTPPVTEEADEGADLRTTAILTPGRDLLDRAGAWADLAEHGTELWTMRIVDAAASPPVTRDFEALDMGDEPFGWNLPNWAIRRALLSRAEALSTVDLRFGTGFAGLLARVAEARVRTTDGDTISTRLLLACDGRSSPVRAAAGISAREVDYGQTALVFSVTHPRPHGNVSTELHLSGGPFTLVPLPDLDGKPRSAVVWMDDADEQARRMDLPEDAFSAEATKRSLSVAGPLTLASRRVAWPIKTIVAHAMTARRVALAAEAAHAMPPIGAQGLNTSLKDIAALRDLCAKHEIGSDPMLQAYARQRQPDVLIRATGIDLLNRTSIAGSAPFQRLRATGVRALHDVAPLRKLAMRLGLGA
ncbi:FAD-dependent oxidoreductase [Jannaschia aquimarina]|uniref:UbiI protein n=1 Tax=Jannaschia aquimarina TaxID=935700 RepID=A0A0D1CSM8_9RHOB|nr:FAD-dependent oxidoreductase [Jannaschia aquimarina]KIT17762.1 2-octaprenylphenol hydroxylase [Jannaschia aquimarina]SNS96019.1 2-octaprenyl-6-methoxyphenol hydroxylase [Jannaschia aquimarina]